METIEAPIEAPTSLARPEPTRFGDRTPLLPGQPGNLHADPAADYFRKLTAEKRHLIATLVARGVSIANAARIVEISVKTVQRALDRGRLDLVRSEEEDVPLTAAGEFAMKVAKAQGTFAMNLQQKYDLAFEKDPRIAMAYLELLGRLQPNDYGRRQVVKVEQDTVVRVAFVEVDKDDWQRGQSKATVQGEVQRQIAGAVAGSPAGNEIIDAELRAIDSEDDNDF